MGFSNYFLVDVYLLELSACSEWLAYLLNGVVPATDNRISINIHCFSTEWKHSELVIHTTWYQRLSFTATEMITALDVPGRYALNKYMF